jgi:hypothetical protein
MTDPIPGELTSVSNLRSNLAGFDSESSVETNHAFILSGARPREYAQIGEIRFRRNSS